MTTDPPGPSFDRTDDFRVRPSPSDDPIVFGQLPARPVACGFGNDRGPESKRPIVSQPVVATVSQCPRNAHRQCQRWFAQQHTGASPPGPYHAFGDQRLADSVAISRDRNKPRHRRTAIQDLHFAAPPDFTDIARGWPSALKSTRSSCDQSGLHRLTTQGQCDTWRCGGLRD